MKSLLLLLDDPDFTAEVPHAVEHYKANDVILEEDDEGRDFYLITEGEVQVRTFIEDKVDNKATGLTKLKEHDLFGELSMFDGEPRSAQVTAMTDCEVVRFDGLKMIEFMDAHPERGYWILKEIFMRLISHMRLSTIRTKTILQLYYTEQAY